MGRVSRKGKRRRWNCSVGKGRFWKGREKKGSQERGWDGVARVWSDRKRKKKGKGREGKGMVWYDTVQERKGRGREGGTARVEKSRKGKNDKVKKRTRKGVKKEIEGKVK